MCQKLQSGTEGYVREHTELEGLLPQLMPWSNLKFCMFSITDLRFIDSGSELPSTTTVCIWCLFQAEVPVFVFTTPRGRGFSNLGPKPKEPSHPMLAEGGSCKFQNPGLLSGGVPAPASLHLYVSAAHPPHRPKTQKDPFWGVIIAFLLLVSSEVRTCFQHILLSFAEWRMIFTGGRWGVRAPLPPRFSSKSCSFQAILRKNLLYILNKFWVKTPLPPDQNPGSAPERAFELNFFFLGTSLFSCFLQMWTISQLTSKFC